MTWKKLLWSDDAVVVRKNSGANIGTRPRLNFVEGSNISLAITDDAGGDEIDISVAVTGIESGADVTDATNVNAAGAVMVSDAAIAFDTITEKTGDAGVNVETVNLKDGHINELQKLIFKNPSELTIASGAITVTQTRHYVDTEGDAASDELTSISGGEEGQILILNTADSSRDVVLKHNVVNILISGGDYTLDSAYKMVILVKAGSYWMKVM